MTGWAYCPLPRYSRTLSFALTYGHDSRVLMPPAIDIVWRWPCLPRFRWLGPLAIAVCLVVFTGPCGWVAFTSPPGPSRTLSCLTCSHGGQLLRLPAIDIVWRWPCLPCFRLLQTPCYSGKLGGLPVLVGSLPYPSPGRMLEPSYIGRLLCLRLG